MRTRGIAIALLVCGIIFGLVAGCRSPAPSPTQTATVLRTLRPPPTPTVSLADTSTPDYFQWIAATLTARPPGLSIEQQKRVVDLLRTNGGCKLPCFWGLVPGETDAEQARRFLEELNRVYERDDRWIGMKTYTASLSYGSDQPGGVEVVLRVPINEGRTEGIYLWGDEANYSEYERDWALYSVREVIEQLGTPDEVYITINELPDQSLGYGLLLILGESGVSYQVSGLSMSKDEICPVLGEGDSSWTIELSLTHVGGPLPIIPSGWPSLESGFWDPIEKVLGMDEQAFAKHILSGRPACFSVVGIDS